ncbi:hypothetical protein [Actinokineospora sp. NBRC 105648]|uniref:hypothetical protein n=1 Tax=Actinokineospora sp. NBRC 105648 TaxID=3032206 RepID=UPI0025530447|nr:hypothetical protein [Actinokineospora sp. NBRC 105648]
MSDFDFLVGGWTVANRKHTAPLTGTDDWDEFPATMSAHSFFGGAGSFDEIHFPTKGWSGCSFRTYDPAQARWTIHWVNSRDGLLQPPVIGSFNGGVGTFYGEDLHDGQPINVRYLWSRITPTAARWEQAFARPGQDWETNWVMEFSR